MAWWLQRWDSVRGSLWFIPGLGALSALIFSVITLTLDAKIDLSRSDAFIWLITTSSASRLILSSLAGALITVTGVVFSMTMLTLSQTSSQFGPRLLRSFLDQSVTQATLAIFVGTSLYCVAILRTIRDIGDDEIFVPHISTFAGLCLGLVSIFCLIYFIHYVAKSIQAESVIRVLSHELDTAIERIIPAENDRTGQIDKAETEQLNDNRSKQLQSIKANRIGYVQAVDIDALSHSADKSKTVFHLRVRPGDYIFHGIPILDIEDHHLEINESLKEHIHEAVLTGEQRTPRQDVGCVIKELVEVAIRALSPGINDPHTAVACINYLSASMAKIAARELPSTIRRNQDGEVRLVMPQLTFAQLLNDAFREIRFYGSNSYLVLEKLANSLLMLTYFIIRTDDAEAIRQQLTTIEQISGDNLKLSVERESILNVIQEAENRLTSFTIDSEEDH